MTARPQTRTSSDDDGLHRNTSCTAKVFSSRVLTEAEQKKLDTYAFWSPKESRVVTVVEPCRLAIALELEFRPTIVEYAERPRSISTPTGLIELCFAYRTTSGTEHYEIFRREKELTAASIRQEQKFITDLLTSALSAGIELLVRKPHRIRDSRVANATRLELLPYVQAAKRLHNAEILLATVRAHLEKHRSTTFFGIERTLCPPFDWRDVRAVACTLIHSGEAEIDVDKPLKSTTDIYRVASM